MHEDSNAFYYDGDNPIYRAMDPEEPAKNHLSFGLGLATEKYQFDWAVDHTIDAGTVFIVSMVHYF